MGLSQAKMNRKLEYIEGIILKKINYKDSSKIIYIYTKDGLTSVLIHGSNNMKSKYLGLAKILSHVALHVSGKDLKTLRDGDILEDNRNILNDLTKYTYCTHILEMIYYFSTHDHDHEKLYLFLLKIFKIVNKNNNYIPYLNMVELKLLYLLGVNPMFNHCVSCNKTTGLKFSIKDGGMCCRNHIREKNNISNSAVSDMIKIYYFDLDKKIELNIKETNLKEIRYVLDKYYAYHLNFKSNSRKILKGLIGY